MKTTKKGPRIALLSGLLLVLVVTTVGFLNWAGLEAWYQFRSDFERLGRNAQGYAEYRHRLTEIVFVSLPGGQFTMGTSETDLALLTDIDPDGFEQYKTEAPQHEVSLSPFLIAKYEVTQSQWKKLMGENPSSAWKSDDYPVTDVSFYDCQTFSQKIGLSLPTEAQWEYACRAGSEGPIAGTGNLDAMGWYFANGDSSRDQLHSGGEKSPNAFGLHDMHGNVMEWCEDIFDGDFYKLPEAREKNPVSTSGSEGRVLRGGSWTDRALYCRSAFRRWDDPSSRSFFTGFRPARPAP